MTSEARDASRESGAPIYLYLFARQSSVWRYTNADRAIVFGGATYTPAAITHGSIRIGGDSSNDRIDVSLPRDLDVAGNWVPFPPADAVMCTVFETHDGETDALMRATGRVVQPRWTDTTLTLVCEPTLTLTRGAAPSPRLQGSCWKTLYSQGPGMCNVDPEAHRVLGTLASVSGFTLNVAAAATFPDGRLVNGTVEWTRSDGIHEIRTIVAHAGNLITVDYGTSEWPTDLSLLPGCRQSWDDCNGYFNNAANCGALEYIPKRNPHDGNPVR